MSTEGSHGDEDRVAGAVCALDKAATDINVLIKPPAAAGPRVKGVVTKSLENTIYLSCRAAAVMCACVLTMVTRARPVPGSGAPITLLKGLQAGDTGGQSVLHVYGNTRDYQHWEHL